MHSKEFSGKVLVLQGSLFRFAKAILGVREEAEDCVQEVIMKLWIKRDSLREVTHLKAYVFRMTRNNCLDRLKMNRINYLEVEDRLPESSLSPYAQVEVHDSLAWVQKIIAALPEQQRTLIHLRNIECMETSEMEAVTGLTSPHIHVALSRARITIRQRYNELDSEK